LSEDEHYFVECGVASLELAIRQVDAFKERAYFKEELKSVLFVLNIAVVTHFHYELSLNPLKIITKDVVKNDLMKGRD